MLAPDVIHPVDLDEYIVTCIDHYVITQSGFTAVKILCASFAYSSLFLPQPVATRDFFTVPIVLPFSRMAYSCNCIVYSALRLGVYGGSECRSRRRGRERLGWDALSTRVSLEDSHTGPENV